MSRVVVTQRHATGFAIFVTPLPVMLDAGGVEGWLSGGNSAVSCDTRSVGGGLFMLEVPLGQFLCGRRRDLSRPTEDLVRSSGYSLGFLRRDAPSSQIVQGIKENISQFVAVARF
ncbi:MAG: hypothetical protein WBX25_21215 [Rhodomicrobium sp.]